MNILVPTSSLWRLCSPDHGLQHCQVRACWIKEKGLCKPLNDEPPEFFKLVNSRPASTQGCEKAFSLAELRFLTDPIIELLRGIFRHLAPNFADHADLLTPSHRLPVPLRSTPSLVRPFALHVVDLYTVSSD